MPEVTQDIGVQMKVMTFQSPTSTGDLVVTTNAGFIPKGYIFKTSQLTADGSAAHIQCGLGFASLTGKRVRNVSIHGTSEDGVTTSVSRRATDNLCVHLRNVANASIVEGTLVSATENTITLNFAKVSATSFIVGVTLIGGQDIIADAGAFTTPTATGILSHRVECRADLVFVASNGVGSIPTTATQFRFTISAFARKAGAEKFSQLAVATDTLTAQTTMHAETMLSTQAVFEISTTSTQVRANIVSTDEESMKINWVQVTAATKENIYLAIQGVEATVDSFPQPTALGITTIESIEGTTKGVFLMASDKTVVFASGNNMAPNNVLAFGCATKPNEQFSSWFGDLDGGTTTEANTHLNTSNVLTIQDTADSANTLVQASYLGTEGDRLRLNFTTVDATARAILFITIGRKLRSPFV